MRRTAESSEYSTVVVSLFSRRRVYTAILFVAAMVPSACLAYRWRHMPHLGFYHDDALYWVGAKSLAEGHEYRILSLPGQPYQTKYPPLFSALLALAWKMAPAFPGNLPIATLLVWLLLPPYLLLLRAMLKRYGFSPLEQALLCLAAGLNPMCALFSFSLMPELLIASLLMLSLLLAERFAVWSGVAAGLAYLTRSAALPLLVTVPLVLILRRRYKQAGLFAMSMLPAVVTWQLFTWRHISPAHDPVTLYYTNYLGLQLHNVGLADLPTVIWHNLDAFVTAIGKLLLFDMGAFSSKHLERVVAIAAIAGVVRLVRRTGNLQYPAAAAAYSALLLVWCYQPDQRFVFPLYPLLLAGLWTELCNFWKAMQQAWHKSGPDRLAAGVGAGALAAFAVFFAFSNLYGLVRVLPDLMAAYQSDLERRLPAYRWIARQVPDSANMFAYDDPLLFLYTGRKACNLPIPPKLIYYDEHATDALVRTIPEFARKQGLEYLLVTSDDFYRDLHRRGIDQLAAAVRENSSLQRDFWSRDASVYRIIPQPATITTNASSICDSARGMPRSPVCREEARYP